MPDVLLIARAADEAYAKRLAALLEAEGAQVGVDLEATAQGRLPPSLKEPLRTAAAVVVLLTAGDRSEPWWQDELVEAIRDVDADRFVPVLVGDRATHNMIWPLVADRSAISLPDPQDLTALIRFLKPLLPARTPLLPVAQAIGVTPRATFGDRPAAAPSHELAGALHRAHRGLFRTSDVPIVPPPRARVDDPQRLTLGDSRQRVSLATIQVLQDLSFRAHGDRGVQVATRVAGRRLVLMDIEAPTDAVLAGQVVNVLRAAVEREDRLPEVLAQLDDRTPFWESLAQVGPHRRPRSHELLQTAIAVANLVQTRLQFAFSVAPPGEWSPQVAPLLSPAPGGCFPMGVAIESFLVARLLKALTHERPAMAEPLDRLAHRMCFNRVVAGVNFPVDAVAGRWIGQVLGDHLLARASAAVTVSSLRLGDTILAEGVSFSAEAATPPGLRKVPWKGGASPILERLWDEARSEW